MARRTRSAVATPRAAAIPAAPAGPLPGESSVSAFPFPGGPGAGWGFGQGYNGADFTRNRGYVYFPQLDTRRELTTFSRTEILRRSRYLTANVGFAGRMVKGLSRMVAGTGLVPRGSTTDSEWNHLALQAFDTRVGTAAVFDVGRRFNFYTSQGATMRMRYGDGDGGVVLTSSQAGAARFAFYEAHQIGNGQLAASDEKSYFDGVRVDRNNGAIAYSLINPDDGSSVEIPTENFIYIGDYESPGKHRTPSILKHAINNLLDITEINTALKMGIKSSSQIGYYIGRQLGAVAKKPAGLPSVGSPRTTTKVDVGTGEKVDLEQVWASGGEIPDLPPGVDIKQLLDTRPHPNTREFISDLARDISWGTDLSPEILWDISKLGGANTRFVLADAQSFVEQEQQKLVDAYCGRVWLYTIAKEMKYGRLRPCKDPEWWKHDWIPPARLTVDYGRDGRLHMEQMRSGALTFRRFYGWQGLDSKQQLTELLDERAWIKEEATKRGLTMADVFPVGAGQAKVVNEPVDNTTNPADPNAKDPEADPAAA